MTGLLRPLRHLLGGFRDVVRHRVVVHHDLFILRKTVDAPPGRHPAFTLVEHAGPGPAVEAALASLGRDLSLERGRRRFEAGLRFFELRCEGRPVAATWALSESERFLDELGIGLRAGEGRLWLRDIFVAAGKRGQGVFAALLDEVLAVFPGTRSLWSAVDRDNQPSRAAHERYGHAPVARYEVLHLFGRVLLRLRWPGGLPLGSAYRAERRILLTGPDYRRFVLERRA